MITDFFFNNGPRNRQLPFIDVLDFGGTLNFNQISK